jgi:ferritin-like metal-binding protein YciE
MSTDSLTVRSQNQVQRYAAVRGPDADERAAAGICWFSLALGVAELLAPRQVAQISGVELNPDLVRLLGARELASGIGILTNSRPTGWLWSRVAGDMMDLAVLATAPLRHERGARGKFLAATAAVAGVTFIDVGLSMRYASKSRRIAPARRTPREQLSHFLSDMYSVEQQAIAQMVTAPELVGDPTLAADFRQHYFETREQARLVRERLEAHGRSASAIKNAIMKLGGKGFLLFARAMPETPGRLVVHAYSYEAMEWAGYEMLIRFAERAGDLNTVETARIIRDQEGIMMERLERGFDAAEEVSHAGLAKDKLPGHLLRHLAEVHAFERQNIQLLKKSERIAGNAQIMALYGHQLEQLGRHKQLVEQRLAVLGSEPSKLEDAALALGGVNWGLFFQAQSDTPAKLAAFVYAVLHLQIGGYELLKRTAGRIGDNATLRLCETIIVEKREMADALTDYFTSAVDATLTELQAS